MPARPPSASIAESHGNAGAASDKGLDQTWYEVGSR
jgi:hypothetical protein